MASHSLAIAKASFAAGLLRPDPTSVSRDSIEHFHTLLHATISQCSPQNVQKCKYWILDNVARSAARFTSLGKYLNALASSFTPTADRKGAREPSIKRKRLHILYLINDILHHGQVYSKDASICSKVQPMLMGLVGSAASFKDCPKHQRKIQNLLSIWEEKSYYGAGYVDKLRETANNAAERGDVVEDAAVSDLKDELSTSKTSKSMPYVMPASHGDSSTPWFDLPAANLMPHIVPNSTKPINPDMIKPLQFVAGPADEALVTAVKNLLDDVETMFGESGKDNKDSWDIDELGELIVRDEINGEIIGGEGYYGWSRSFCEKMRRRKKGLDMPELDEDRGRDSRSRSRSSSRSVRKRRHDDSGDDSSQERYNSRPRRRVSSSRSRSPDDGYRRNFENKSRSRHVSPQRSPTPPRRGNPYAQESIPSQSQYQGTPYQPPPPPPQMPSQMGFQPAFNPNFPPPPPLQNYNNQTQQYGSWPPPPPPQNMNFSPSQPWPPPPPPGNPPPMNYQQLHPPQPPFPQYPPHGQGNWQQQGDGRGYNNGGSNNGWNNNGPPNRGRGNFRGRGRGW